MKKCAFCPTEAKKLSGEHIWDDWLNDVLPKTKFRVQQQRSPRDPLLEYDSVIIKEKLPVVCTPCNNNWMSDITNEVKQCFADTIIKGKPVLLSPKDAALLACFTFMKSVVADHATERDDRFFTRGARERFRTSLTIPPEVQVWVAAYHGIHRYGGRFVTRTYTPNTSGTLDGHEFFAFTYVVGQLVLQSLTPRWKHIGHKARPLPTLTPNVRWNPAVVRFWPTDGSLISWPPPKYLGDDMIERFVERFKASMNLKFA